MKSKNPLAYRSVMRIDVRPPVGDYVPTKPFKAIPNVESSTRGHREQPLGRSVVCQGCHARKPKRGGWNSACPGINDRRVFIGGAD